MHIAHYWSQLKPSDMTNKEKRTFNTVGAEEAEGSQ